MNAAKSLNVGLLMLKQQKDRQLLLLPLQRAPTLGHCDHLTSVTVRLRKSPMVILKLLILLIKANFYFTDDNNMDLGA